GHDRQSSAQRLGERERQGSLALSKRTVQIDEDARSAEELYHFQRSQVPFVSVVEVCPAGKATLDLGPNLQSMASPGAPPRIATRQDHQRALSIAAPRSLEPPISNGVVHKIDVGEPCSTPMARVGRHLYQRWVVSYSPDVLYGGDRARIPRPAGFKKDR